MAPRRKPTRASIAPTQGGTSRDYAMRKLAKDRPDLYAMVAARKLSAHAAMINAGFRVPAFTVRDSPESIAETLRRRWPSSRIAELARLLGHDGEGSAV